MVDFMANCAYMSHKEVFKYTHTHQCQIKLLVSVESLVYCFYKCGFLVILALIKWVTFPDNYLSSEYYILNSKCMKLTLEVFIL